MVLVHSHLSQDKFIQKWYDRSYNSGEMAKKALSKYSKFLEEINETDETIFVKLSEIKGSEDFYLFLNKIVEYFAGSLHSNSTKAYFSFVKDYYRRNGFRIYNEDIRQFVDIPKSPKEKKAPLEKEKIALLASSAEKYLKGVIYCLVSSGMRSSEFLQLQKTDIKWNLDPVEVHLRAEITKTKVDRVTYLSPQAVEFFPKTKPYDERTSLVNLEKSFGYLRKKCHLVDRYRNSNVHHITPHRLRAFFKTEASNMHGKDYAEDIIGHEGYLNTYYVINDEERRKKYKELIPKVTI